MPKPFEFDAPYSLSAKEGGWFALNAHGVIVASFSVESWGSEKACIEAAWAHAYVSHDDRVTIEGVREAVARGWCADGNAGKEMDADLAEAITREVYALVASLD